MLVLALDTSTPAVTAGLCRVDPQGTAPVEVLAQRVTVDARAHAELLTPHILECLGQAGAAADDLDAVVVGCGPGPFTGLRVGMSTAAAFADALAIPVYGVCSLDGLAARARAARVAGELLVVTDARRREVYSALYDAAGVRVAGPRVGAATEINGAGVDAAVGDPGLIAAIDLPAGARIVAELCSPDPAGLVTVARPQLASGTRSGPLEALYLRRPDAVPPAPRPVSAALTGRASEREPS